MAPRTLNAIDQKTLLVSPALPSNGLDHLRLLPLQAGGVALVGLFLTLPTKSISSLGPDVPPNRHQRQVGKLGVLTSSSPVHLWSSSSRCLPQKWPLQKSQSPAIRCGWSLQPAKEHRIFLGAIFLRGKVESVFLGCCFEMGEWFLGAAVACGVLAGPTGSQCGRRWAWKDKEGEIRFVFVQKGRPRRLKENAEVARAP